MTEQMSAAEHKPRLLLVDDDEIFCQVLAQALGRRGFEVSIAHSVRQAMHICEQVQAEYAVIDLSMPGDSGLNLIPALQLNHPDCRIVILTGYASITTAVEAIKLGATHYLSKPANADEIVAAFNHQPGNPDQAINETPLSVERLEWEHIQKVLNQCDGNISEAARLLNMHRRTLQRKLKKRPVRQ